MPVNAYLVFNGNCREAVEYYAQAFGVEVPKIMTFGEAHGSDEHLPIGSENLVMHAHLMINGSSVMFSDNFPGMEFIVGNNITLAVISNDVEEIRSYFDKLKADGTATMELQETFWSKCYGQVTDKYGIQWQLSYDSGEM